MAERQNKNRTYDSRSLSDDFKKKFIISLKGKDHILYKGLIQLGHDKGIKGFKCRLVQFPKQENNFTAIAEATLIDPDGNEWTDFADANVNNCTSLVAPHFPRLASTRAKARVLRDYLGIDMVCFEELQSPWEQRPMTMMQKQYLAELIQKKGLSGEQARALSITVCRKAKSDDLTEEDGWDLISHLERLPDKGVDQQPVESAQAETTNESSEAAQESA